MIEAISKGSRDSQNRWLSEFTKAVYEAARYITENTTEDETYSLDDFFVTENEEINIEHYQARAREKLRGDIALARDPSFSERYKAGYSFPKVPQMGDDFDDFAMDWSRNLFNKMRRDNPQNRLAKLIKKVIEREELGSLESPQALLDWLRSDWENLCPVLTAYHK
ncbi:hypothetical protein [uncultured Thiodictyon sp.]|uniref:hypothetical protein n=1 Tax=uncultured Thiodictyon sp. TaxID=1846217 RepID=UPI0025EF654B|nr:hypothetical protein [uncultured Thiodictyon sp.]